MAFAEQAPAWGGGLYVNLQEETPLLHTQDEVLRPEVEAEAERRRKAAEKALARSLEHRVTEFSD